MTLEKSLIHSCRAKVATSAISEAVIYYILIIGLLEIRLITHQRSQFLYLEPSHVFTDT